MIAANKTVRLMPVTYLLDRVYHNKFAARPAVQYLFQFYIRGRITQNMAHNDLSAVFFMCGKQPFSFFLAVGNRFFQKYVVT